MIVYLTWGETPRSYGVFGSQTVGQFKSNAESAPGLKYMFVSGVPVIHSGVYREKFQYAGELKKIQEKLVDIPFCVIWIPTIQTYINSNEKTFFKLHSRAAHRKLAEIVKDAQVVHCRSYHAAWAALQTKNFYNLTYRIIFDVRGFWPEEVTYRKGYSEKISSYIFRKEIEKELVEKCECIVSVSRTMEDHMNEIGGRISKLILLSCDTNLAEEYPVQRVAKEKYRLTYCGALGHSTWHSPIALRNLYDKFKLELGATSLHLITTSPSANFMDAFSDLENGEVCISQAHSLDDVYRHLSVGDFYALSYRIPTNFIERTLARAVLATKTAEYSAFGRTILCNNYCGGASSLVDEHDLGITYSPHTHKEITKNNLMAAFGKVPDRDLINELFSAESHARQYADIYVELCS